MWAVQTQQKQLLPLLSEQPALAVAQARATSPTTPRRPAVDINLDAGLDLRLLQENGYQRLSKLVNSDLKELTALDKAINTNLKVLMAKNQ